MPGPVQISIAIALCGLAGHSAAADLHYRLRYIAASAAMQVQVCSDTPAAQRHFSLDPGAERYISQMQRVRGEPVEFADGDWIASDWRAGDCVSYQAALGEIAQRRETDVGYTVGDDLLTAPQQWLLHTRSRDPAEVNLSLPAGYTLSAPWQPLPDAQSGERRYRIPVTPPSWSASVAIGRFSEQRIQVHGAQLRLSILGNVPVATRQRLQTWIGEVAAAAESAYGRLPVPDVQVLLLPLRTPQSRAVVFGQSTRGQGNALTLLIDPDRPAAEFRDDWTAVHEMAHLFHPYLGDSGRWLAEGLASYWQNVLRARSGVLKPAEAWRRLDAGFGRGRDDPRNGSSLAELVDGRGRSNAFMRIYWSGAAYWLSVDTQLRQRDPDLSIDLALQRFADCCLAERRRWLPIEFVSKLDDLLGVDLFTKQFRDFDQQRRFPDLAPIYREIGLQRKGTDRMLLDDAAPAAAARRAIMNEVPPG